MNDAIIGATAHTMGELLSDDAALVTGVNRMGTVALDISELRGRGISKFAPAF